jgi:acetyl esterase/lipase
MTMIPKRPVLEPAAQALADSSANPPYPFQLGPAAGRAALAQAQSGPVAKPDVEVENITISGGLVGEVSIRIVRPRQATTSLPAILYVHGSSWVVGDQHTHARLVDELAVGATAAVVIPDYSRSPEEQYPTALEESYAALRWTAERSEKHRLDGTRIAVVGDSAGGNIAAALTILAKQRSVPKIAAQVLFYPITDAAFESDSYQQFADGYYLRRDEMQWLWDQYVPRPERRSEITACPLRAATGQLVGLPRALVITAEADVVRDEGEAYASKLRAAGVGVTAIRYPAIIHDFVMLNALRETTAAQAAISRATTYLKQSLGVDPHRAATPTADTAEPNRPGAER